MAKTIIEVKKSGSETNATLLRKFSRKVQDSQIVPSLKKKRYASRKPSKLTQKSAAMKRIEKRKINARLRKLGKIA